MPGAIAATEAEILSPAWLAWICTWAAYSTTCALVRIRLPSMTTPEPEISTGASLVQGRAKSGWRTVANTFTTAFSAPWEMAGEGSGAGLLATGFSGGAGGAWAAAPAATSQLASRKRSVTGIGGGLGAWTWR